ncbi:hypothetical protein [Micromonospora sp. NBC_01813]|uniref:hypothetical protein n=1 Tax=Micromonospora sp. NBC_01813 TaxID=2975988 RepID=UPI002DDB7C23|nr:hypothetical protein [Micromonospora sp. NBC_01813]WSA10308.1 hypothetical protein OG958_05805 [Micromonospora sp. NBC_01813]
MQPDSPYQLIAMLGSCQVGSVWSAVEPGGEPLTVAILDAAVAEDQRWREAFSATANSLTGTRPGEHAFRYADFTATTPWVACGTEPGQGAERIFEALGQDYQAVPPDLPTPESAASPAGTRGRPDPAAVQASTALGPISPAGNPWSGTPLRPPGQPTSPAQPSASAAAGEALPAPHPISGAQALPGSPTSSAPYPVSGSGYAPTDAIQGYGPYPPEGPPAHRPVYPPVPRFAPTPRPKRLPRGLILGAALTVVVLVAVGAAVVWWPDAPDAPAVADPSASPTAVTAPAGLPTAIPLEPGVEPPLDGQWPRDWPRFVPTDALRTFTDLADLGFTLRVPRTWECVSSRQDDKTGSLQCGSAFGDGQDLGGEVVVRPCPEGCSVDRRAAMRRAEEAWGLQWVQAGATAVYAETSVLQVDGEQRYALVIVAYWRGGLDGVLDRQLVLRMTAPVEGAGQLRRIANHLRDSLLF